MEIKVYQSHIEVFPYEEGDCPTLEKMLSKREKVSAKYFITVPVAFHIEEDTLYLPRGINTSLLEEFFHTAPIPVTKADPYLKFKEGAPLLPPLNRMQKEGIEFLTAEGDFSYTGWYSQLGLNLATGDGKTYGSICAILKLKIRAIIITHQDKLKKQWIAAIKTKTTFPEDRLCDISGSHIMEEIMEGKIDADIFCVNQQTIASFARKYSWLDVRKFFQKIKVGIKVIDESHKFFENSLMIDYFSNCYKSIYATATFGRSTTSENAIYKKAYQSLARFGEETLNYEEKRKHIVFTGCYFNSHPEYGMLPNLKVRGYFSSYKYIDYEFEEEPHKVLLKVLRKILDISLENTDGKILVLSPKIATVEFLADYIEDYTGIKTSIIHSKINKEDIEEAKKSRILSSTIKSVGEGFDNVGLQVLILLEPVGSSILMDQVIGRLREYAPDKDTYVFYPMDMTIPDIIRLFNKSSKPLEKKCKKVNFVRMD